MSERWFFRSPYYSADANSLEGTTLSARWVLQMPMLIGALGDMGSTRSRKSEYGQRKMGIGSTRSRESHHFAPEAELTYPTLLGVGAFFDRERAAVGLQ